MNKGDMVHVIGSAESATLNVKFLINEYQEEFPPFKLNIPLSMVYKKDGYELIRRSYRMPGMCCVNQAWPSIGLFLRYMLNL
ncbi:hypothetical protein [Paenibacillus allorhizoplanae]|uniref:hypothetical protein n=1 Tax=Paenibacillus allorhizoplanae TaxID=2905648 RepID=UPI001F2BF455|nr:hypothetical protein [Paenibacillus allorhizoplanae]